MGALPEDPQWYLDNVLVHAEPGSQGPVAPLGPVAIWRDTWQRRAGGASGLLEVAAGRGFVLTTSELAEAGVTRSAMRAAVRRGDWWQPARGYVCPLPHDRLGSPHMVERSRHALTSAASWRARPGHAVAGRSSAILHGLPVLRTPDEPELVAPDRAGLGRRGPGHAYGAALSDDETTRWYGVRSTSIARTLVDLGRHNRWDAIMAADAALRERVVSRAAVEAALSKAVGWPGVRGARSVLAFADAASESPLESVLRLQLALDGFPEPELQAEVGPYRVDFLWRRQRLILEADGRGKYDADALWREKRREHQLRGLGYRIERVLWSDLFARWPGTAARLWAALRTH